MAREQFQREALSSAWSVGLWGCPRAPRRRVAELSACVRRELQVHLSNALEIASTGGRVIARYFARPKLARVRAPLVFVGYVAVGRNVSTPPRYPGGELPAGGFAAATVEGVVLGPAFLLSQHLRHVVA